MIKGEKRLERFCVGKMPIFMDWKELLKFRQKEGNWFLNMLCQGFLYKDGYKKDGPER